MRLYADRLNEHLSHSLQPVYLLFGNEPLLLHESRIAIRDAARQRGFDERHRFSIDSQFDWQPVYDCCQALSLFSTRQLIELDLPESGVNAAIGKQLAEVGSMLNPDIILVVIGQKLTKAQENSKWFKALHSNGCLVNCLSPDMQRLPQFVQARCRASGLKPDAEAVQMLAQWHEGNLFALAQSLEKLALLYPDGQLTLLRVESALSRHNHYSVFHWIDALLAGKGNRAQRILRQLESEGIEAVLLIRSIQKELKLLLTLQSMQTQGQPLAKAFEQHRIWQSKRPLYSAALQRLPQTKLLQLLRLLAEIEVRFKTQYEQSCWPLLHQLSAQCCVAHFSLT